MLHLIKHLLYWDLNSKLTYSDDWLLPIRFSLSANDYRLTSSIRESCTSLRVVTPVKLYKCPQRTIIFNQLDSGLTQLTEPTHLRGIWTYPFRTQPTPAAPHQTIQKKQKKRLIASFSGSALALRARSHTPLSPPPHLRKLFFLGFHRVWLAKDDLSLAIAQKRKRKFFRFLFSEQPPKLDGWEKKGDIFKAIINPSDKLPIPIICMFVDDRSFWPDQ